MRYFGRIKMEKGVVVERNIKVYPITSNDISDRIMNKLLKDIDVPN